MLLCLLGMYSYSRIPRPFIRAKYMYPKTFGTLTQIMCSLGLPFQNLLHMECVVSPVPRYLRHIIVLYLRLNSHVPSRMRLYFNIIFAMYNFYQTSLLFIEFIGIMQISSIQNYYASSIYCIVRLPPKVTSPSVTMYLTPFTSSTTLLPH